jgi:hypothetical protein
MSGAITPLPQYAFMAWCSVKTQRQLYLYLYNSSGISLLPTSYKILSNILLSRLNPYADEIIGDDQCGFRRNRAADTIDLHPSDAG